MVQKPSIWFQRVFRLLLASKQSSAISNKPPFELSMKDARASHEMPIIEEKATQGGQVTPRRWMINVEEVRELI